MLQMYSLTKQKQSHRQKTNFWLPKGKQVGKGWIRSLELAGSVVKNLPASAGDTREAGLISGSGRCPGGGNGNPLQYSCLENSMDRGAGQAIVHGVAKELETT